MKALVTQRGVFARSANLFTGKSFGEDVKEEDIPLSIPSKTEVLVKIHAVALNPIDAKFIDFIAPPGKIAGCDFAGVIEEIGEAALGRWKVNDRVAGFVQGGIDEGRGSFAEYIKVEADLIWKIPDTISDEAASTYGISAATAMQALHLHLDVPWPDENGNQQSPAGTSIFIYAGSSSVGLFAIQMAKMAGYKVITTASPHSFELVKAYGADHVFDYHEPTAVQDIATAHPSITRALDCFSEGKSTEFCAQILQNNGGKVVTLLDTKASIPGVEVKMIMSFQLLGRAFAWLSPIGPKYPASSTDRDALVRFYASLFQLARIIKAPPLTSIDGGFGGISEGLGRLRSKQVSGSKLVVKF
ncbi:putative ToxD-like zinc binding oxidoreductase [Aaosphaeria arxii CBS 175.79]|uniref:Putative ToxD-like zinc binding oxidoreductase n=1 Tax=Aaosphaeria arxii CBS 175.79 TaxID=1450172 RepID=A0A6A5XDB6_9PLEO|nr:putative ToxD-like zinc binding oxidoreductase [Aaosphaeria arxii CBS 175.79]KAF2010909.1 putative ToxD-like zinc binding oxidoreductase [Aaosphaeria arxii CBS 175.79]